MQRPATGACGCCLLPVCSSLVGTGGGDFCQVPNHRLVLIESQEVFSGITKSISKVPNQTGTISSWPSLLEMNLLISVLAVPVALILLVEMSLHCPFQCNMMEGGYHWPRGILSTEGRDSALCRSPSAGPAGAKPKRSKC